MKIHHLNIRKEQPDDAKQIRRVNLQAFATDAEANLVDALRNSNIELVSLVADENGKIVGHILFSPVKFDANIKTMGLAPMAVLPEWQNKGIGSKLVEEGLNACIQAGYDAVVVLGHPNYYPRFGFTPSVNFGIKSEYDVPAEVFMARELTKDCLQNLSGTVKYNSAFNSV